MHGPGAWQPPFGFHARPHRDGEAVEATHGCKPAVVGLVVADEDRHASAERRLGQIAGQRLEPFTEDEYRSLSGRLANAARYRESNQVLDEWAASYPASRGRDEIEAAAILNLYNLRDNDQAMARGDAFVARHPDSPAVSAVRLTQFRLEVREGRTEQARRRGMAYWQGDVRGASLVDRQSAARLLAAYLVSVGDAAGGLALYEVLLGTLTTASDRVDVLWRMGVAALRLGDAASAFEHLQRVLDLDPSSPKRPLSLAWNVGIGQERFAAPGDDVGVFGSVGLSWHRQSSVIADFNGREFGLAVSVVPFYRIPLVFTAGAINLTERFADTEFAAGVGYLHSF